MNHLVEHPQVTSTTQVSGFSRHQIEAAAVAVGVGIAFALGVFGRFSGLGNFPLAEDEYFFVQAVRATVEHGVPALEAGGYYTRGLLVQYLTAGSVLLFGYTEFAYRLPAALFSLATVPLAYIYAKRLLGATAGYGLAAILLLSAWEIEFGRFARMYAALQFVTLLFFIALDKGFCAPRSRWIYVPHVVLVIAILTHELAVLFVPILLAYTVALTARTWHATGRPSFAFPLITSAVVLACYYYFTFGFRELGVENPLPVDYPDGAGGSRWRFPFFPFFRHIDPAVPLLTYLGLGAALAAAFAALRRLRKPVAEADLLGALLVLSAVFHQFLVGVSIVVVMTARQHIFGVGADKRRSRFALLFATAIAAVWLAYAMSFRDWIITTWRPDYSLVNALIRTFFGWPDLIGPVVVPWKDHLPIVGICAALAVVHQVMTKARVDPITWARNPTVVVIFFVTAFGLLNQTYTSIRYSFLLYPFVLALIIMSATEAATAVMRRLSRDTRARQVIGVTVCIGIFAASPDFNVRQIAGVAGQDVRLRLGEFEGYGGIWYDRWDYETPAMFVNARASIRAGDKTVVVTQPTVSYYLRVPHAVYYDRNDPRFFDVSRSQGTIDFWSNQPLLSTADELRTYTRCAANLWLVQGRAGSLQAFDIQQVWGRQLLRQAEAFRSVDDRLEVRRIELRADSNC